ncbi:MAG: choice-of-anchor J domain-containing protein [Bacteroidales bacterium]|nr:choice-of-anchor J domain-containing protein [Bacteroidales bacterium]
MKKHTINFRSGGLFALLVLFAILALAFTQVYDREEISQKYSIERVSGTSFGNNPVIIGTDTDSSMAVPLAPWWGYSFTQTLYLQSEINVVDKRIYRIGYQYVGVTPDPDLLVEVWMSHTDLNQITASLPLTNFTKVYDGQYVVEIGGDYSFIDIEPFFYNNTDNLIITIIEKKPGYTSPQDMFLSTPALSPPALCIGARNDQTPYDPNNLPAGSVYEERANIIMMVEDVPTTPEVKVIPDSLNFGEVEATQTEIRTVKVMNIGGGELEVSGANITDDHFTLLDATFPIILGPGESQLIDIQFLPTDPGLIEATLTFLVDESVPGGRICDLTGRGLRFGVLREGFEGELFPPLGWKVYDNNNDGEGWFRNLTTAPTGQTVPYNGIAAAGLDTYAGSPGQIGYDDWLITPKMIWQDGDIFKFFIKRLANQDGQVWRICLSTTGDLISNFTPFDVITDPPITYSEKSYDLSSLGLTNGSTFYIGFQFNSLWCWPGVIDDVLGSVKVSFDNDLMALAFAGDDIIYENTTNNFTAVVGNTGFNNVGAGDYQVKACAMVNGVETIFGSVNGQAILAGESVVHTIPVTILETGVYGLYSKVVWGGDMNPQNNTSEVLQVEVIGSSIVVKNIGTYPLTPQTPYYNLYPINFDDFRGASQHECLYYPGELNTGGIVTRLSYYAAIGTFLPQRKIKVWMTQTDLANFDQGAIPASEMTLVFDGEVTFQEGLGRVNFNLTQPFVYTGGNGLAVMVYYYQGGNPYIVDDANFAYEYLEYGPLRNGFDNWYTTIDPNNLSHMAYVPSYPVTSLMFDTGDGLGSLSGKVLYQENSAPVEDARAVIENPAYPESAAVLYTNDSGDYNAPFVLAGDNLTVTISKYGYTDIIIENIDLAPGESIVLPDAYLVTRPLVALSGSVLKSDTQGPAENATVRLLGMDDYETTTNEIGEFVFGEIWGLTTYQLEITLDGYQTYIADIAVADISLTLDPVTLLENAPSPHMLTAQEVGTDVQLTWYGAGAPFPYQFRYDDGVAVGVLITTGSPEIIGGSAWKNNSIIHAVQWFTYQSGTYPPSPEVLVTILGLNPDGSPNPNDLLFSKGQVPNNYGWNTLTLTNPVYAPDGFFFGTSGYSNYTLIAYDNGVGEPWVWQPMTQWSNGMGAYYPLETVTSPPLFGNIFMRASGLIYENDQPENFDVGAPFVVNIEGKNNPFLCLPIQPIETGDPEVSKEFVLPANRTFEHYNIYRRLVGEEIWEQINDSPVNDTTYMDNEWIALEPGYYIYSVEAEYSNGVKSNMALSNVLQKVATRITEPQSVFIELYPNPSSGIFNLKSEEKMLQLTIYDHSGQMVAVRKTEDFNLLIDLSHLKSGVYFLEIETSKDLIKRKLAVINN